MKGCTRGTGHSISCIAPSRWTMHMSQPTCTSAISIWRRRNPLRRSITSATLLLSIPPTNMHGPPWKPRVTAPPNWRLRLASSPNEGLRRAAGFFHGEPTVHCIQHLGRTLRQGLPIGAALDFGRLGRLIGVIHAGEVMKFARSRAAIQAFDVALLADGQRRIDIDFKEIPDTPPHLIPHGAIRGDGRDKHNDAIASQQLGHETDPANVFIAILLAETEVLTEVLPHDVAIEPFHL